MLMFIDHKDQAEMVSSESDPEPEFIDDSDRLREFVETVKATADEHEEVPPLLESLADPFEELLADDDWLAERYQELAMDDVNDKGAIWERTSPSGCCIGRETNCRCSRSSFRQALRRRSTIIAWGLVGIYGGTQREVLPPGR